MENTMRRKIGYDARMIEHSGIGIRIQHILKYWPITESEAEFFVFGDEEVLKKHNLPPHAKVIPYNAGIYSIRELFGHSLMKQMDILDIPHFNVPIFFIRKCIVTIHDLIPFHFKNVHSSFIKRIYLQIILRLVSYFSLRVIAVSNYTKIDLHNQFHRPLHQIEVMYNGIDPTIFREQHAELVAKFKSKWNLPNEFLLAIGIGKKHKNFDFLIENLMKLWCENKLTTPLVIGGLGKEIPMEIQTCKDQFPDKVFLLSHLPYEDLPLVYQSAKLFIFPSLFEGFGFPVLEAQAVGTPVLSSNATVLPEILNESAVLFDATDAVDFRVQLLSLLDNQAKSRELSKLGWQNSQRFLWKDQIAHLKDFYQKILL
jgi:glycosyltransferase involved in cell wall biosynthesis